MTLIGISGKKRSGKNTVAKFINCNLGQVVHEIAFADALKEEVADACETPLHLIEQSKESFRTILQWWGTEFRREMSGEQYWVNKLKERIQFICDCVETRRIHGSTESDALIVITDVRFPNEAQMVKDMGGVMLRVNRSGTFRQNLRRRLWPTSAEKHRSETALDDWNFDYVIDNASGLETLEIRTQQFLLALSSAGKLDLSSRATATNPAETR